MCRSLRNRIIGGATVGAALLLGSLSAFATNSLDCASGTGFGRNQLRVVGLTDDGQLVCFNERTPRRVREIGYVSGLVSPDTALIGIDFRVQDGQLYGVGNGGGVYRIDTDNAAAVRVNSLTEALSGTSFGVDFNPTADRLRVVSNTGQNLRHNVNAGGTTIPDGTLNYVAGTPAAGIEGAAYTNNDLDAATITTLFDLDTNLDQIAIQAPPNNGSLSATGKLGVDVGPAAGFDIYSTLFQGRDDYQSWLRGAQRQWRVLLLPHQRADRRGDLRRQLQGCRRRHRDSSGSIGADRPVAVHAATGRFVRAQLCDELSH